MSACVALAPAIDVARSPDSLVSTKASVMTVAATRRATIRRRVRKLSMRVGSLGRFGPKRDHAIPAPNGGEQSLTSDAWRARAAPIWGSHASVHEPAAHALLRLGAQPGGFRGDRRRGAGHDSRRVPPARWQRAHPDR